MDLAFAIPDDRDRLKEAARLARSLLNNPRIAQNPPLGAWLGVLTGQPRLAVGLSGTQKTIATAVPGDLGAAGGALLLYSALGGPVDS